MSEEEQQQMWKRSPTPEETWSDASGGNDSGEWPVIGVVGEELRLDGTPRYVGNSSIPDSIHDVRWGNWHRADGSNTTWDTEDFDSRGVLNRWKRVQKRLRNTLADISLDMEVPWPDDAVHKRPTQHRKQAYEEKLEKRRAGGPISTADWDAEVDAAYARLQEPERGESNSRLRVRRSVGGAGPSMSAAAAGPSRRGRMSSSSSPALSVASRDQLSTVISTPKRGRSRLTSVAASSPRSRPTTVASRSTPSTSSLRKGTTPSSTGSSSEPQSTSGSLASVLVSQPSLRARIQTTWNRTARDARAATVRISNDIADADISPDLRQLKYIERGYVFYTGLQEIFEVSPDVFTKCDCSTCIDASQCHCQDLSELYNEDDTKVFAYFRGLFTFNVPRGVEVIECNEHCGCNPKCGNRVAQLPRDVAIEVFDTKRCGWGARALVDICEGKVLGTYTGTRKLNDVSRREDVEYLPEEHQGYLFDLDSTEVKGAENLGGRYTVDSYEFGNWTRFVNHSCSPNMRVYSVVYDTISDVNMPYMAFVASKNISAGTELTIDYHPYGEEEDDEKGKKPANARACSCGSKSCRGWMKL
ncbi:SET domain-containing protein [Paxillus ammoniavirescens]|nr:SET domain-containing protein [Paxillus ammoniavirescens]